MAYGSAVYKSTDGGHLGVPAANSPAGAQAVKQWLAGTVYPALAIVQNGGFVFSTVAGGTSAAASIGPTPGALTDNTVTWVLLGSIGGLYVSNDATQRMALGTVIEGEDSGPNMYGKAEFRYVKFTGASDIQAGDVIAIDAQGQTGVGCPAAAPGANKGQIFGVAMAPQKLSAATPTYGFVMIRGVFDGASVKTTFTAGAVLSGGGSVGAVKADAATPLANYILDGALLRAGAAQYQATVELYWPISSGR